MYWSCGTVRLVSLGGRDGFGMGKQEMIQNFGGETFWITYSWEMEKEMAE